MLNLNNLDGNDVFIRFYYVPQFQNEVDNVNTLKEMASRLAHAYFICNSTAESGRRIGLDIVNGGVIRRQFRDYKGLVMVVNERYAFTDENDFCLMGKGQYSDNDFMNILKIISNYLSLIPGTRFTPNPNLQFTQGFVWKNQGNYKNNMRSFDA